MRKYIAVLILLCVILFRAVAPAYAADTPVTAIVNGKTAERVHLRAGPSIDSPSMGLYFTGTLVYCESDTNAEWVKVTIGRLVGYMKSELLYFGNPVNIKPAQPYLITYYIGDVFIFEEPYYNSLRVPIPTADQTYAVLGQTHEYFYYLYHIGTGRFGYLHQDHDYPSGRTGFRLPAYPHYDASSYNYTLRPYKRDDDFCTIIGEYPYFTNVNLTWLNNSLAQHSIKILQDGIDKYGNSNPITITYKCDVAIADDGLLSVVYSGTYAAAGLSGLYKINHSYTYNLYDR